MGCFSFKNLIPLIVILSLAIILYIFGLSNHITLQTIKAKETVIFSWIDLHPFLSALTISFLYILSITLLIPASIALTIIAAMAYPLPYALFLSILSETMGNCLFFIILRLAFSPISSEQTTGYFEKAEKSFKKNPSSYLLFLRFSHLTPSWLIATLAVMFKTPLFTFTWTTLFGSIPVCYLSVQTGRVLKHSAKNFHIFNLHDFFNTDAKLLFLGFGLLSLTPVLIKKFMKP